MPSLGHSYSVTPEPPDIPTPESAARPADADAGFDAATYGDSFADVYDEWYPDVSDAAATAEFVDGLGAGQRVLELGTGTGRLSRALAQRGHRVVGIDASIAMLDRFDDPASAPVAADMAQLPFAPASFDCVLVATNTLFNLATAEAQAACFAAAAHVVRPGGHMIVEADVPAPSDPSFDRLVSTRSISPDRVVLTATIRDDAAQTVTGQHIDISGDGIRLRPWKIRFVGPAELDRLAADAGLERTGRFADWHRSGFAEDSAHHVTVYSR